MKSRVFAPSSLTVLFPQTSRASLIVCIGSAPFLSLAQCGEATSTCQPGYACLSSSLSSRATPCVSGTYAPAGSVACTNCSAGYFSTATAASCTPCSIGQFASVNASTVCQTCAAPPGYACQGAATSAAGTVCPNGTYGVGGNSGCVQCPVGQYSGATGAWSASNCTSCNAGVGYYCPVQSTNSSGIACPAGRYGPGGVSDCVNCSSAPGFYCPRASVNSSGVKCPVGQFGLGGGTVCALCPAGLFGATVGVSSINCSGTCNPGYFCSAGSSSASAAVCTIGKYSTGGAGICTSCSPGQFGNATGLSSANCSGLCYPGRYGSSLGLTTGNCTGACSAGYYCVAGTTNATATPCPSGQFSANASASCSNCSCPAGYACPSGSSTTTCVSCVAGRFGSGAASPCTDCSAPAGFGCPDASPNNTGAPCGVGQYGPGLASPCQPCPAGTFGNTTGLQSPSCSGLCAAGYACPSGSTVGTAVACSQGSWSPAGAAVCSSCSSGRYGNTTGMTTALCTDACAAGYMCPPGSVSPTAMPCDVGTFSTGNASACSPCPAGYFGNATGMSSPLCSGMCNAGRYGSPGMTMASCAGLCLAGYACPPGSTNATAIMCPAGQYSVNGAGVCTPCAAGLYGSSMGLSSADCSGPCDGGYFGNTTGLSSSSCSGQCLAGYACPSGSVTATASVCSAGQYSAAGSSVCTTCGVGVFGNASGLGTAQCSGSCAAGRYGATSGLTTTDCSGPCSPGYACPAGSTSATQVLCTSGTYSVGSAGVCSLCSAGRWSSDVARSSDCDNSCPVGSYCPAGSSSPTLCPAGTYGSSPSLATSACSGVCVAGYYCAAGSTTATAARCWSGPQSFCPQV